MRRNKVFIVFLAVFSCLISLYSIDVEAKTLKDSFASSISYTDLTVPTFAKPVIKVKKSVTAKTNGYTNRKQYHHVLAYIGGSRTSTSGCVAKKRTYGYGNIAATATQTSEVVCTYSANTGFWERSLGWRQICFKTAYTKYGMGK